MVTTVSIAVTVTKLTVVVDMTKHYDQLASYPAGQFTVIVDKTWEDSLLKDSFDDTEFDIAKLANDIDMCKYDWFELRVRIMFEDIEMGSAYMGCLLYENPEEVLTDGVAQDLLATATVEANKRVIDLREKMSLLTTIPEGV